MSRYDPPPPPLHYVIGDFPLKEYLCSCWEIEGPAIAHKERLDACCPEAKFRIEKHESGWGMQKNWITIQAACADANTRDDRRRAPDSAQPNGA